MPDPSSAPPFRAAVPSQADDQATLPPAPGATGDESADGPSRFLIPGYEIVGELGRGGMGVVYEARQIGLGRTVAIKMILAGAHAGSADLARFQTEAEAIARLRHPNIVQVYEVGVCDGSPFFSLEFCPGGSLETKLAGTPLPPAEAAALVETLARAVQAAHEQRVVHRDLKPANVLLASGACERPGSSPSGRSHAPLAELCPKITDFGLAKKLDEAGQTVSGSVMGTPSYMAPEQAGGHSKEIGPAADTYALGAILYECLTGRPPFKAATALDTLLQVVSAEPVPPSRLQPGVPRDLETVCLKCLRKEPGQRYASAGDLADDLRRFQVQEPVKARPLGSAARLFRWARRRPAVAALSAALLLLALVGFVAVTAALVVVNQQRQRAEQSQQELLETNTKLTRARADALTKAREIEDTAYVNSIALAQQLWRANQVPRARQILAACPAGQRGWEWHYLWRLCHAELFSAPVPDGMVTALAFSRDGRFLAAVDGGSEVTVREVPSGRVVLRLPSEAKRDGMLEGLAFSPDGKQLARTEDGVVKVCAVPSGKELSAFRCPSCRFSCLVYTPTGRLLAAGENRWANENKSEEEPRLEVWDIGARQRKAALAGVLLTKEWKILHPTGLALSPDGSFLAAVVIDSGTRIKTKPREGPDKKDDPKPPDRNPFKARLKVWEVKSGREVGRAPAGENQINQVAFHPRGLRLAWGDGLMVREGDFNSNAPLRVLRGHQEEVWSVAYSPDGKSLATASIDGTVRVWDLESGAERFVLRGHNEPVLRLAFGAGGRVASGSGIKDAPPAALRLWDATADPEVRTARFPAGGYSLCAALSPDGQRIALYSSPKVNGGDREVTLHDLPAATALRTRGIAELWPLGTAFRADGKLFAGERQDEAVHVFDAGTGKEQLTLPLPSSSQKGYHVVKVAFGSRNRLAAAWLERAKQRPSIPSPSRAARGPLRLHGIVWDLQTRRASYTFDVPVLTPNSPEVFGSFVTALSFDPAGRRLAASLFLMRADRGLMTAAGEVHILEAGGKELAAHRYDYQMTGLAFRPDGRQLAAAGGTSDEGRVIVWDMESGKEVLSLRGHNRPIGGVAFSPDGSRLATAGYDKTVKLWNARTGRETLTLSGHTRPVNFVTFSADGTRLVSATGTKWMEAASGGIPPFLRLPAEVKVWDAGKR
jgi:WD40 repeat protein